MPFEEMPPNWWFREDSQVGGIPEPICMYLIRNGFLIIKYTYPCGNLENIKNYNTKKK